MCDAVESGGAGRGEIHLVSTAAYMAATEAVKLCCDEGVQIFGGMVRKLRRVASRCGCDVFHWVFARTNISLSLSLSLFSRMQGFMREEEINGLYRTVKTSEIAGGSMEIRKLIIAKELLNR
jgi:alkylation response protein AidB-like acyl-CoA dehydrogenase